MKTKTKAYMADKVSKPTKYGSSVVSAARRSADVRHPTTKQFQRRDLAKSAQFGG